MKTNKKLTLTVTKKDYDREIASGIAPEHALRPGKHHFQRASRFAKPADLKKRNIKMTVSIRLDGDIVEFFKARAAVPNAAPYQTQINAALRAYMEAGASGLGEIDIEKLLRNETFLSALADRVRARV